MELDLFLLHDAEHLATGANAHELNRLMGLYRNGAEKKNAEWFATAETALRRYVSTLTRWNAARPTCKHGDMIPKELEVNGKVYRWMFCEACGHAVDRA